MAVLLGMKARAVLERGRPGCGTCDIEVPDGPEGSQRLLVALVAGGEGEGRLLHRPRTPHASTEDAKAMLHLLGRLDRPGAPERLALAKKDAGRMVRDPRVWKAIGSVATLLGGQGEADDAAVRDAVAAAGLLPAAEARARKPASREASKPHRSA